MYNFIRKIFQPKTAEKTVLAYRDIPAWIGDQEQKAKEQLTEKAVAPMTAIRNSLAGLQLIVNGIGGAEHDPAMHPKLKSITKNSLPLFVRSMNTALAKELPDDSEEFYVAAAECVKACLGSMKGQGRYLQVTFPEEMKSARTKIDEAGRELNVLTGALRDHRARIAQLNAIREIFTAIEEKKAQGAKAEERLMRIAARISEAEARIAQIDAERSVLDADPSQGEITVRQQELDTMKEERIRLHRVYASHSMTASHVLRKAEKIAARTHQGEREGLFARASDLLSHHEMPACNELKEILDKVFPLAASMADSGELPLKNKEERLMFADPADSVGKICTICADLTVIEADYRSKEELLSQNPIIRKRASLEREKSHLGAVCAKERQAEQEIAGWKADAESSLPVHLAELGKRISAAAGGEVEIRAGEE